MKIIKPLMKSIREYKKSSILSIFFISMEVLMEIFLPFITKRLIDDMNSGILNNVWIYAIILVVMASLSLTFGVLAGKSCAIASVGFGKNLRHDLFAKVQDFSFENIDKFSTSSLVTRMTTDVTYVQMAYMMIIRTAIRCPLMFIFSIIMAFVVGGNMAFVFVVVIPILAVVLFLIANKAMKLFDKVFKKYDKLNESIQENISGIRVVKSYVREDYETKKFKKASNEVFNEFTRAEKIVALNNPSMTFAMYTISLTVSIIGSIYIINTKELEGLTVGGLSSLLTYGIQILMSLMMLSMVFVMITISSASMKRIVEVLTEKSTIHNPIDPVMNVNNGEIIFKDVSFKYSKEAEKNALENINLSIPSGSTVGIIGGTGSSKTTLIQLISRLYDTTEGNVYVGGVDVRDYDIETLRNQVSVVLQKNVLFSGTIKDNLRWGNPEATDEEIIEACKISKADEFIETLPNKYDTMIERGGTNVSGGQKQRLCIARALLKNPKVIIFDDSTSAVDTKTDALIRNGLKKYIPSTTKIIIAQRISSIMDSDIIIVMDGGKINQIGTHEELLRTNEIYQEVYSTQNKIGGIGNA